MTPARLDVAALMAAGVKRRTAQRIVSQDRLPVHGRNRAIAERLLAEAAAAADPPDDAAGAPSAHVVGGYDSAAAAFAGMAPGRTVHALSDGRWNLVDALEAMLERTGPCDLTISTWTIGLASIARLSTLLGAGKMRSMRVCVDRSFESRHPKYVAAVRDLVGARGVRCWNSHAKFVIAADGERLSAVMATSANMNTNPRIESYAVACDPALVRGYGALIDRLWREQGDGEGFGAAARNARKHTEAVFEAMLAAAPRRGEAISEKKRFLAERDAIGAERAPEPPPAPSASVGWADMKREEDAKLTREKRIASERQNAVEAGELVSRAEVRAAHARAGQALRAGVESAVRVVGALCPDDVRPAVVAELEAEYARMRAAVASALEGAA